MPAAGWRQILVRAWKESKRDQVPLLAAGVAFYSFLALFPALIAAITLYGLVADPETVARQADQLTDAMPSDAASLVTDQLDALASAPQQSLGLGLLVALALALWSASGGVGNIVTAINIAYDEEETRGFIRRKLLSLALTAAAIVFLVVTIGLVAVAPAVLDDTVSDAPLRWVFEAGRWVLLAAAVTLALAVVYRYAPDRDAPRFSWVSTGAVTATVIWLAASLGFSLYVDNFGNYSKTYGALAGVVVLLLWLWITNFIVLLGAEINAEAEQQTARDTTIGPERPLGERGAVKADSLPGDGEEAAESTSPTSADGPR
ncbi:YihY/virulence factor BrkB family protein [Nocardioides gansuensis]|uniref:YihY/virulence factor BrkB family protein n=2 Tax=Nocardioides gansuensis TaxID=2138300 RepID=A0A2T8F4U7_9ACTN|nr:YihY/virulence factor BrkB family protein [Nocardioides gansuensis]